MTHHSYQQVYRGFTQQVENSRIVLSSDPIDVAAITASIEAIQAILTDQILGLSLVSLDPLIAQRLRGLAVEIHKQLRLLHTDHLFLQSAKNSTTRQQRQQQMLERLTLLARYGEMAIGDE
jgi:hypothetical protein